MLLTLLTMLSQKKAAQPFVSVSALSEPVPSVWCFMATMPHFREARHLAQDCNGREICSGPPQWSSSNLTGCIHWAIKASQFFRGVKYFSMSNDFNLYIDSSINPMDVWGGILSHKTSKHMAHIFIMLTVGVIINKCSIFPLNHLLTANLPVLWLGAAGCPVRSRHPKEGSHELVLCIQMPSSEQNFNLEAKTISDWVPHGSYSTHFLWSMTESKMILNV